MPPDAIISEAPSVEAAAPAAAPDTSTSNDAVYDNAASEIFDSPAKASTETAQDDDGGDPVQEQNDAPADESPLTLSQQRILSRAKIDPKMVASWPGEALENFITQLQEMQASQDQLGAELARAKQPDPKVQKPAEEVIEPTEFSKEVDELFEKLAETYDSDIKPVGQMINKMHSAIEKRISELSQSQAAFEEMGRVMSDMLIDTAMSGIVDKYPSAKTADGRKQVIERFWKEWNTGEYDQPGVSIRDQIRDAIENAAKVTFRNVNEASAAANLVQQNRERVKSQPRVNGSNNKQGSRSQDDIYDEAYLKAFGS